MEASLTASGVLGNLEHNTREIRRPADSSAIQAVLEFQVSLYCCVGGASYCIC